MYCPGCGIQLTETGSFCPLCGRDLQPLRRLADGSEPPQQLPMQAPWGGRQVSLGIVLVGIAFLLISAATLLLERLGGGLAWGAWLGSHAIGAVILISVWLLAQHQGQLPLAAIGLRRPITSWPVSILLAGMALGLSLGATALYAWLMTLLGADIFVPPDVPKDIIFDGLGVIWTFEALALWTPLTEEIFFRGFIMAGLAHRWGVSGAAIGSAAIFSLFHLHPGVLLPIFFTGLLLAVLYRTTGSLWPPVIAHAGQNAVALVAIIYGG